MKYTGDFDKIETSKEGNILINTPAGEITDHAPQSFYKETSEKINPIAIGSSFKLNDNTVSFLIPTTCLAGRQANNKQQTIIIDPWTIFPTALGTTVFYPNGVAYDIEIDNSGNVYVEGGESPYKIAKYSPTGNWIWTYTLPDASLWSPYYSKFCILPQTGVIFIGEGLNMGGPSSGTGPRVMRITTNGNVDLTSGNFSGTEEIWTMFYNPCTSQLIGFGGGTLTPNNMQITNTSLSSNTAKNFNSYTTTHNDVCSVDMDENGDFYTVTTSQVGYGNNVLHKSRASTNYNPPTAFSIQTTYQYREANGGLPTGGASVRANGLSINSSYCYTYDGKTVNAWNKTTGAMLGSIVTSTSYPWGGENRSHDGIEVDECNNVYVGGDSKIHVYYFNGTTFSPGTPLPALPGEVYDLCLGPSNNLYVCGDGFVSELALPVTAPCDNFHITPSGTNITCTVNGTATVTATGGTEPYHYLWSPGAETTQTITVTSPGSYIVTVTDDACFQRIKIDTVVVISIGGFTVASTQSNVICNGGNNGSITMTTTGGISPFTYSWSPSVGTSSTASGLIAGTYTVTISDANGCVKQSTVTITQPTAISTTFITTPDSCNTHNGSATVNASNGTGSYSYNWSSGEGTNATITGLSAGTYTITVTDANACTVTNSVDIASSASVTAIAGPDQSVCYGDNTTLSASGGSVYQWSPASSLSDPNIANPIANPIATTTYTVSVSNGSGCFSTDNVTITVHPQVIPNAGPDQAICTGQGIAIMNATGGANYAWSPSTGLTNTNTYNPSASPPTNTTYTVTVSDIYGCSKTDDVTVNVNPIPSYTYVTDSANCNGGSDGSITITPSGGSSPYLYVWSPSVSTTAVATSIPAGSYKVTITDNNGCTTNATISVAATPSPSTTTSSHNEICGRANGSADVTASSGSGGYTYFWSNNSSTSTATGLTAGNYSVTVTDNNGCTNSTSVNVMETPGPDADFSAHPNVLTIMDGPVSFIDNSSGTVTDWEWNFGDGSQNGSGKELNHDYDNIGTYLVTLIVTDNNGCKDTTTDTIKVRDIFTFYVPNAFSPDGDGIDDSFYPKGINWDPNHFEMYIFDRWGNLIYQTKNVEDRWNGTVNNKGKRDDMLVDVYVYLIRVKELEGPKHEYIGKVTLVR